MKRLLTLAALAALALPASSATIFTHPNNAGGLIRLTDVEGECSRNEKIAYSSIPANGRTFFGCWVYLSDDDLVMIRWDGTRDVISLPLPGFTATPTGRARYGNGSTTKSGDL